MGGCSEAILEKAIRSVGECDSDLASQVATDDLEIDRLDVAIDEGVLKALALQAPVAADLRLVLAIKMVASDLERVGDLSRNIAKSAQRLAAKESPLPLPAMLVPMARASQDALRQSLDAFARGDAALARAVLELDDQIDDQEEEIVRDLLKELEAHPEAAAREVDVILVTKHIERVADHATNIAEQVILVTEARNVKHAAKLATIVPPK